MIGYIWFPSLVEEVFEDLLIKHDFQVIKEYNHSIVFQNQFLKFAIAIEDYTEVICYFAYKMKDGFSKSINCLSLLEQMNGLNYYNQKREEINKIYWNKDINESIYEIIKTKVLLFHEIIKTYLMDMVKGSVSD